MKWLSRLLGGSRRARPPNVSVQPAPAPDVQRSSLVLPPAPDMENARSPEPELAESVGGEPVDDGVEELAWPEGDEAEEPAEQDEDDPTLGRYEALDETTPDLQKLTEMRALAEIRALSAPHRINVWDATGPGSQAETSARLERQGRLTSQIKDDPETGPYIYYEPVDRKQP